MSEKPILFSGPMVRAILDGRKTQTRRVLKPQPEADGLYHDMKAAHRALRWLKGDRLWVREAFAIGFDYDAEDKPIGDEPKLFYAATNAVRWFDTETDEWRDAPRWKPSIHMPRWASRITLEVTGVKVERLQDISDADARAEGVERDSDGWRDYLEPSTQCCATAKTSFLTLWDRINGPGSWEANPWVVAVAFRVLPRDQASASRSGEGPPSACAGGPSASQ
jgi:hypothetical protein